MKVLMIGQDFPPTVLGGLQTASYGLTKGLSKQNGADGSFIVPKVFQGRYKSNSIFIGAKDVSASHRKGILKKINHCSEFNRVGSKPFYSVDSYFK